MMKNNIYQNISDNYYKCKSDDYSYYEKGKVYHGAIILEHLIEYPDDW